MSRRSGQTGYIERSGNWYVVRFWMDVVGQEKRRLVRERVCPTSGPGRLSASERKRKGREIVAASGADSVKHFEQVVLQPSLGVTFRQQAETYLEWVTMRDREPIRDISTIRGALNKWILPVIGDLPLSQVHNGTVKAVVDRMKQFRSAVGGTLSPRTIGLYVSLVGRVVASLKNRETGEPIYNRKWDSTFMDLPILVHKAQRRPSLKADAITQLVNGSEGDEQSLYVLLAAAGLRVSEALALETRQFINAGRTIEIRQQVDRQKPRIVSYLKTDAAYRDVDLHPDVAEFLQRFMGRKNGLLFATANGTPHLHNNIEERWLTARLRKMGLDEPGMGWHAFRRFRKTWLRGKRCQEDINIFWMGHKPMTMSEIYSRLFDELDMRLAEAEAVGYGFRLPPNGCLIPMIPKNEAQIVREVAV